MITAMSLVQSFGIYFKSELGVRVSTLGCDAHWTTPHDSGMLSIVLLCDWIRFLQAHYVRWGKSYWYGVIGNYSMTYVKMGAFEYMHIWLIPSDILT